MKVDQTVKKETIYIAAWCAIFSVLMQAVFLIIGKWHIYVVFGNLLGIFTAVSNFFLMGLSVQKAVTKEPDDAKKLIKASHGLRNLFIIIMAVIGIVVPFFNSYAAIIPLFFPRISILIRGFLVKK